MTRQTHIQKTGKLSDYLTYIHIDFQTKETVKMNINIIVTVTVTIINTDTVTVTITVIVTEKGYVYTHSYSKDTDLIITTFKFFQRLTYHYRYSQNYRNCNQRVNKRIISSLSESIRYHYFS